MYFVYIFLISFLLKLAETIRLQLLLKFFIDYKLTHF